MRENMKKSKFTESQIFNILKKADSDLAVVDICGKYGIAHAIFYK
jgi:putative transposase